MQATTPTKSNVVRQTIAFSDILNSFPKAIPEQVFGYGGLGATELLAGLVKVWFNLVRTSNVQILNGT